ncbi:MAG: hypothetical protein ACOX3Q_11875 [Clostridia bacterium]|nr:histidine phosphatase family protein [Clostridiaceae bacterium]
MVEVYKHVPKELAQDIVHCGLKLSQYGTVTVEGKGGVSRYIPCYFNPKDEKELYGKEDYACIRITIPNNYCKVGNEFLRNDTNELINDLFEQSLMPVDQYLFGMYRKPVCLITRTVQAGEIALAGKHLDYPVIVDDAERLYLQNILTCRTEENEKWLDAVLYAYYCDLADKGYVVKIESPETGISVFINKDRQIVTLKIPSMEEVPF